MNMSAYQAASKAYASVDLETSINSASPHKLILMLYEGAITSLHRAKALMQEKKIEEKGKEISRAISIIDEGLAACLNQDQGGDIAVNLASLYEYLSFRLLQANMHNNIEWVEEVMTLLNELKGAWEQIGDAAAMPAATTSPAEAANESLQLETMPTALNNNTNAESTVSVSYGKV